MANAIGSIYSCVAVPLLTFIQILSMWGYVVGYVVDCGFKCSENPIFCMTVKFQCCNGQFQQLHNFQRWGNTTLLKFTGTWKYAEYIVYQRKCPYWDSDLLFIWFIWLVFSTRSNSMQVVVCQFHASLLSHYHFKPTAQPGRRFLPHHGQLSDSCRPVSWLGWLEPNRKVKIALLGFDAN